MSEITYPKGSRGYVPTTGRGSGEKPKEEERQAPKERGGNPINFDLMTEEEKAAWLAEHTGHSTRGQLSLGQQLEALPKPAKAGIAVAVLLAGLIAFLSWFNRRKKK
jgi:hypothetical protein